MRKLHVLIHIGLYDIQGWSTREVSAPGSLALATGRPLLVVPYAYDMFGNAEYFRRLGMARVNARMNVRLPASPRSGLHPVGSIL